MEQPSTRRNGPLGWLTRRSARFWILVFLAPILYALSFGPACGIASRHRWLEPALRRVYLPLAWATMVVLPGAFRAVLDYGASWEDQAARGEIGGVALGVMLFAVEGDPE